MSCKRAAVLHRAPYRHAAEGESIWWIKPRVANLQFLRLLARSKVAIAALFATVVFLPPKMANAAIVSTTGDVVVATPPADITNGQWESNTQIRAFAEQQEVVLVSSLPVDISVSGTSPSAVDSNLSPATIQAGTIVDSYALHFDVVGSLETKNAKEATGSITFSSDVLGIIALSDSLNETNSAVGLPGVLYASGADHGLDLDPAGGGTSDIVTLSADLRTITVDWRDASFPDDLRVVTAVPEPTAWALGVSGTAILFIWLVQRAGDPSNRRLAERFSRPQT